MLKKIKSIFFIKKIFSYTDEGEKLKLNLIKYNKNIQNALNISIINYKFFSTRYIIYEQNGTGKEYDIKDKLLYEGEFIKGKRHGKGKEYDLYRNECKLIFEGEFFNGKKYGKGKEYYFNGNVKYEGEYYDDRKTVGCGYDFKGKNKYNINLNGIRKEYYNNGVLKFEGEYLDGKKNGKGKEYYQYSYRQDEKLLKFEGEYIKGIINGLGKEYDLYTKLMI